MLVEWTGNIFEVTGRLFELIEVCTVLNKEISCCLNEFVSLLNSSFC